MRNDAQPGLVNHNGVTEARLCVLRCVEVSRTKSRNSQILALISAPEELERDFGAGYGITI